ncbi:MAG: methyltransferase domain-containing protein [Roseiflexaceae bacterium]|nr:class I SAM-dependent methyltransferase [Roseiflexus sp.]MDW8214740.1 methyltransferase domain-containing protein [Roseiflexaceae bacterium]
MALSAPVALYARLIRWAFARFYQEFAWTYDTVAALVSSGQWRAWTLTALEFARGATLELGCGTGHVQLALAQSHSGFFAGLDRSPQMIRLARRRLAQFGSCTPLVRADARALPFVSESFDTIIATFPSDYIAEDATIAEIRRVLRPGGTVAIALWARFADDSLYARLVDAAYRVTLQRSPRPAALASLDALRRFGERFERAGIDVSFREVTTSGGIVQYVLGTRRVSQ